MGEKTSVYCEFCAAEMNRVENEIAFSSRDVAGHDAIVEATYNVCDSCAEKIGTWAAEHKTAADAKWNRNPPTKIDVSL